MTHGNVATAHGTCEGCWQRDVDLHEAPYPDPRTGHHKMICTDSFACAKAWSRNWSTSTVDKRWRR